MAAVENINGVSETMLQTLYVKAKESEKPNHKIYDKKAIEIIEQGDRSLVEGMEVIYPVFKLIGKIGPVRNISNKIAVLEK